MTLRSFPTGSRAVLLAALALATAVIAATLIAPGASAQVPTDFPTTTQLKITPPHAPIKPLAGVAVLTAQVDYSVFVGAPPAQATQVTLHVAEQPPWATVSISPSTLYFDVHPSPGAGMQQSATPQRVSLLVATTADAPAFTPGTVRITATAHPNFPYGGSTSEDATLITADYFSLLDARGPDEDVRVGEDEVEVPVTVRNFGNGVTKVRFSVVDAPGDVRVELPASFTLDSRQTGGRAEDVVRTVPVRVSAPDGLRGAVDVTLRVDGAYALDERLKGASEEIVLHLEPAGGTAAPAAAGVGALGLLGGGAGVAAAVRRARGGGGA